MMGSWHGPDNTDQLLALAQELDPDKRIDRGFLMKKLRESNLIMTARFYVPDERELLVQMHTWQRDVKAMGDEVRWVMCRETLDALAARWRDKRTAAPPTWDSSFWRTEGSDLPSAALEIEVYDIIEHSRVWTDQTRLFGHPVRVDPAARSPLFEINTTMTQKKSRW